MKHFSLLQLLSLSFACGTPTTNEDAGTDAGLDAGACNEASDCVGKGLPEGNCPGSFECRSNKCYWACPSDCGGCDAGSFCFQACEGYPGGQLSGCLPNCKEDSHCPSGQTCDLSNCAGAPQMAMTCGPCTGTCK
jgi:hypothetical protein